MALSENVGHLVHTVGNDLISIGALNRDDSEAIESMLSHGVTLLVWQAKHDKSGLSWKSPIESQ